MEFIIEYFSEDVQIEIFALPDKLAARYVFLSKRMVEHGPDLGMPHTKPLRDGLCEIRLMSPEGIARIMFCTVVGRRIVMLHSFIKKTQKTPAKDLELGLKRMKEIKDANSRSVSKKVAKSPKGKGRG
jgi:phage-related protein